MAIYGTRDRMLLTADGRAWMVALRQTSIDAIVNPINAMVNKKADEIKTTIKTESDETQTKLDNIADVLGAVSQHLANIEANTRPGIQDISIEGSTEVIVGQTITLAVHPLLTNGFAASDAVTWTSADPAIATVSDAGVVTGKKAGEVHIIAHVRDKKADHTVTVTDPIHSIAITGNTSIAAHGGTTQLTATATKVSGETADVTNSVKWNSMNDGIATVNETGENLGLVTGHSAGTVDITATADNVTGKISITVA